MKVNELIKLLQESVEENPEVGEYVVCLHIYGDDPYTELKQTEVDSVFNYLYLESE